MSVLILTIPITVTLVILFILFFLGAVHNGQFEDLETPAYCPLLDDEGKVQMTKDNKILESLSINSKSQQECEGEKENA